MRQYISHIDRLLRGDATSSSALSFGTLILPVNKILVAGLMLGLVHGLCIGTYTLVNGNDAIFQRLIATMIKVPLLFALTLIVTYPSLYVFNAVVGSRLKSGDVIRLLLASLGVMVAILASFGPIVAFFSVSTTNYHFMLLLNVAVFATAGALGVRFMLRTLERLTHAQQHDGDSDDRVSTKPDDGESLESDAPPESYDDVEMIPTVGDVSVDRHETDTDDDGDRVSEVFLQRKNRQGALDRSGEPVDPNVRRLFRIWIVVFGLVGAQMGWVLRPVVGDPNLPFEWLRGRESDFFEAVLSAVAGWLI